MCVDFAKIHRLNKYQCVFLRNTKMALHSMRATSLSNYLLFKAEPLLACQALFFTENFTEDFSTKQCQGTLCNIVPWFGTTHKTHIGRKEQKF